MSFIERDGFRLHYQVEGRQDAPWLILSNSLGTTIDMWDPQIGAFLEYFRVLRYDTRGHGASGVLPGPYSVAQLGGDVLAIMDHLGIERAHFCGLSMGGMTGMWLGVNAPERIDALVLCNTSAQIGTPEQWNARIDKVRKDGMAAIADAVVERWFTPEFAAAAPYQIERVRAVLLKSPVEGYVANCAAVRDMDQRAQLGSIRARTMVIAGTHDLATPAHDSRAAAEAIPGARYLELDAAHISNWERAHRFTNAVIDFLGSR